MRLLYLDVEWANSQNKSICQMGLILENSDTGEFLLPELNVYIDPEDNFDGMCMNVHHISPRQVEGCKNFADTWREVSEYFRDSVIVGHNIKSSDLNALVRNLMRYNIDIPEMWCIDTYSLARKLVEPFQLPDYKLSTLCKYFDIDMGTEHDAYDDTCACMEVFHAFMKYYGINIEDYVECYKNTECKEYAPYVSSMEFRREINQLYGVISGIEMDQKIMDKEIEYLMKWREKHNKYMQLDTIGFVIDIIDDIVADGVVTFYELNLLKNEIIRYLHLEKSCRETAATQYLQGLIEGIKSDEIIQDDEVYKLQKWLYENDFLIGNYPYDKLIKHVNLILEDNVIAREERITLSNVFNEIFKPLENISINTIQFMNKSFCLSGSFEYGKKSDVETYICEKGGVIDKTVKRTTDYVVVGSIGSDLYSNGTYGTKVKKAMEINVAVIKEEQLYS